MTVESFDGVIKMTQIVPVDTQTCQPDATYEASWIGAIVEDDAQLALQLLDGHLDTVSNMVLRYEMLYDSNNVEHAVKKHGLAWTSYAPDNVWSSAAVFNARKVMTVLVEQRVAATAKTTHGNNYLHCLIAFASVEEEEVEYEVLSSAEYIRSLLNDVEYKQVLLAENHLGLRPLELASHLGTMVLFKYIFESRTVYMTIVKDMGFHSIQYYDITEYVTGNRFYKSPPYTMMLLEEKRVGLVAVRNVFLTDPMKTWFSAIMFSNVPYLIFWALLRTSFLSAFFYSMLLSEDITRFSADRFNSSISQTIPTNVSIQELIDAADTSMRYAVSYTCVYSSCALFYDIVSLIYTYFRFRRWHLKALYGNKCIAAYTKFYDLAQSCILISALVAGQGVLHSSMQSSYDFSVLQYLDPMLVITVCASVWSILYFLQLVPGINIYVIAIQRMLRDFANFGLVFGLFFFTFSFGLSILTNETSFTAGLYRTFQLMLNIVNYNFNDTTSKFVHVAFIFMIVYLLLNILIAIFTSAYEHVTRNKDVIQQVQSLTITMITEAIASTLLAPLHNRLRRKHLIYMENKVYVTKVAMKQRHRWVPITLFTVFCQTHTRCMYIYSNVRVPLIDMSTVKKIHGEMFSFYV